MAENTPKLAAATAVAAALSLLATPAAALDLPRPAAARVIDADALDAERGGRHRRHHDDDDIDAGDVVAGVVILGAIAAIAGAANRQNRARYEERYPVPDEDAAFIPGRYQHGIDRAVDMCVGEIERTSERVGSVDSATRAADGWHVAGELASGGPYSCTVGNDGQIGDVFIGDPGVAAAPAEDGQWDDDDYSAARANQSPDEPGLDGAAGDDGRYDIAKAPDFAQ